MTRTVWWGVVILAAATALPAASAPDDDSATVSALRAFEERVTRVYARQLARAGPPAAASAPPAVSAPPPPTARLSLRGVLDRMAISTAWQVEQDSWRAGIRLRYSRAVEFDPATHSYALVEAV